MTKPELEIEVQSLQGIIDAMESEIRATEGNVWMTPQEYDRMRSFEAKLMEANDTISQGKIRESKQSDVMIELAQGISILAKNHRGNQ